LGFLGPQDKDSQFLSGTLLVFWMEEFYLVFEKVNSGSET
jgi:hypothetical protein